MSELAIMDHTGDTKIIWDPDNTDEVSAARAAFDAAKAKGFMAFKVKNSGKAGEQIREFDPQAGKIIMSPALAGG